MIHFNYSIEEFDFVLLSKQSGNPKEKQRFLILANLQDGKKQADIADMFKISLSTVKRTVRRFKEHGPCGLNDRPRSGAPVKLPYSEHEDFKAYILHLQQEMPGGRLTGYDVQEILLNERDTACSLSAVYNLMHRLNLSWISCRSRRPEQDEQVQEDFKKLRRTGCGPSSGRY